MWSSRLFWKFFLVYAGFNLMLALGFLITVSVWQRIQVDQFAEQTLESTAVVLSSYLRPELDVFFSEDSQETDKSATRLRLQSLLKSLSNETNLRITVIDDNGDVVAESDHDPESMLDHSNRDELIEARQHGIGAAKRRSPTLGIEMYYLALSVKTQNDARVFIRVAMPLNTINQQALAVQSGMTFFVFAFGIVAVGITYAAVGRIIRPLNQLKQGVEAITTEKTDKLVVVESTDEIGDLAAAFNDMQRELTARLSDLRENNEALATVLGSMDEGIIAVDADEKVLLANDASRTLLDSVLVDHVGRPLLEVARSLPLQQAMQESLTNNRTLQTEFEATGEPRRALSLRATCLPGNPCPGVVLVLRDVSELRRLENLRQEFVANVSHELKTPLAAIKAYAETLSLGAVNDTENNLGFVARIEEQADRLHQLILDMIQIARIESGQESFEITDVDLGDVMESCAAQYANEANLKNIRFAIEPPDESIVVSADEDGTRIILENLIDNAIKYTSENGEITVRFRRDGSSAVLEVQDTGIGIAEQDQLRIFERFYRADKARSRDLGGTGLGLSIVKHLTHAFGGSVGLESELGKGSKFTVRLPLA